MLRKTIHLGLALALTMGAAQLAACSSSDSDGGNGQTGNNGGAGNGGNGGTDSEADSGADPGTGGGTPSQACADPGPSCGHAPAASADAVAGDGTGSVVLAVSKLYLGDTDRDGNESDQAWKSFGFNVDDRITKASSNDVCKPVAKADKALVKTDGDNGIDNSFGVNIIPLLAQVAGGASDKVNDSINKGSFTIMLKLDDLGTGGDYKDIAAALYGGGNLEKTPLWDGTDEWPVLCELLDDCALPSTKGSLDKPRIKFANSYVSGRTWVSGTPGDVSLTLAIMGYSLSVVVHHATITMDLSADNTKATNGVIGGVIATDELKDSIRALASPLLNTCDVDSVLDLIVQASDIMKDGTQDPNATCDGISAGIGFDAELVKLGEVTDPTPPAEDPCAK